MTETSDSPSATPGSVPGAGPGQQLYERIKTGTGGQIQFRNVDPTTTTASASTTGGGTTTVTTLTQTLDGAAVATNMSVSITTNGTPDSATVQLRRNGNALVSLNGTTTGNTSVSNILTPASRDATVDVRVTLSMTAGTGTVNVTAFTVSRESLWTA